MRPVDKRHVLVSLLSFLCLIIFYCSSALAVSADATSRASKDEVAYWANELKNRKPVSLARPAKDG